MRALCVRVRERAVISLFENNVGVGWYVYPPEAFNVLKALRYMVLAPLRIDFNRLPNEKSGELPQLPAFSIDILRQVCYNVLGRKTRRDTITVAVAFSIPRKRNIFFAFLEEREVMQWTT